MYMCLVLLATLASQATSFGIQRASSSIFRTSRCNLYLSTQNIEPKSSRDHVTSSSLRNVNRSLKLLLPFAFLASSGAATPVKAAGGEAAYINSLAILLAARTIFAPAKEYVELQAYDAARTNTQYLLNQLQFQKNLENLQRSSIDYCDDMDIIEQAQDAANRITNTLLQYDGSVYTCIFIPSDDGTLHKFRLS